MRERPILMSAPMVLACRREVDPKTQTRRGVKGAPPCASGCYRRPDGLWIWVNGERPDNGPGPGVGMSEAFPCPYGVPGDRLYVRETFRLDVAYNGGKPTDAPREAAVFYEADGAKVGDGVPGKTRVSIHMPRWACRTVLEITEVRVERLNACSEADARAEGVVWSDQWQGFVVPGVEHPNKDFPVLSRATAQGMYAALWDTINDSGAWLGNPWVWAVSFQRVEA